MLRQDKDTYSYSQGDKDFTTIVERVWSELSFLVVEDNRWLGERVVYSSEGCRKVIKTFGFGVVIWFQRSLVTDE